MKNALFLLLVFFQFSLFSQVDNTMYGLYQIANPPSFQFASIDPITGQVTPSACSLWM